MFDVGDAVALRHEVRNTDGVLTNATVALTVTAPSGTTVAPTITNTSTGIYDAAALVADEAGVWAYAWMVSGTVTDVSAGTFYVVVQAPPAYVTTSSVKSALGKLTSDDRDELIAQAARSASRLIDRRTGRQFWTEVTPSERTFGTERAFRDWAGYGLLVDDIADSTGVVVTVGGVTVSGITYGPRNAAAYGRPITVLRPAASTSANPFTAEVTVAARWGWPYVPDEVQQAALLLAARLYRRRDSPQGVIGSAEWGAIRVGRFDPDVEALISPFILAGIA
jgi:hypothetical protein